MTSPPIPQPFIWRRFHSLMGLWLVLYLILHLVTNSQAALFFGDDGEGFIHDVNRIHSLPYLVLIETFLIGVPFLVHMVWGVKYLFTAAYNSSPSDGTRPSLPEYPSNHAYTWQRITAWLLIIAVVLHVGQMRFQNYPVVTQKGGEKYFMVRLDLDQGLHTVAKRVHAVLYDENKIRADEELVASVESVPTGTSPSDLLLAQEHREMVNWAKALRTRPLKPGQVLAVANNYGTAALLMVRETFKSPLMVALYSLFVLAACFHAFNGLWTFLITWGVTPPRVQPLMLKIAMSIMVAISFLGLAAAWGTYWINLYE